MENRVSKIQMETLLEYMNENLDIAAGTGFGMLVNQKMRKHISEQWEQIAVKLNSCAGATKHAKRWRRYWIDIKYKVNMKVTDIKQTYLLKGEPISDEKLRQSLSPIEAKVLDLTDKVIGSGVFGALSRVCKKYSNKSNYRKYLTQSLKPLDLSMKKRRAVASQQDPNDSIIVEDVITILDDDFPNSDITHTVRSVMTQTIRPTREFSTQTRKRKTRAKRVQPNVEPQAPKEFIEIEVKEEQKNESDKETAMDNENSCLDTEERLMYVKTKHGEFSLVLHPNLLD